MSSLDQAVQTQINNIQKKTGKTLDELAALVKASGLTKHGEIRDMLKRDLGLAMVTPIPSSMWFCSQMVSALPKVKTKAKCWMKSTPAKRPACALSMMR